MKLIYPSTFCGLIFSILSCSIPLKAQKKQGDSTDNFPKSSLYSNHVYKKNIQTVQLTAPDFELSQALLYLNSGQLQLSFDDLNAELQSYSYTFIHCNANWEPSDMMSSEFIDGFADNAMTDYRYSNNTLQKYIHYQALFPNNSTRFTKSGNYILKLYQDNDPDDVVLTRRFMICESRVAITGEVTAASIISDRNYKQEIDFTIDHSGYPINNPYGDLNVVLLQNNHFGSIKSGLKPVYVKDQQLVYDYDDDNVFPGGNEFRNFDIKSLTYKTQYVASVKRHEDGYHVLLFADEKRAFKQYSFQQDINGNFVVKTEERTNSETDAEYCFVHFYLAYNEFISDGQLYVYGAFNGWSCTPENRLQYNAERMGYECILYLKQGYYNYEYILMNDQQQIDESFVEGSHAVTENDYTILVYHRFPGTFYDQLIGVKRLNSTRNN